MCSPKVEYYVRLVLVPLFILINGASSALNFIGAEYEPGIGFAISTFLLFTFLVMVVRLGYKTIPQQIYERMSREQVNASKKQSIESESSLLIRNNASKQGSTVINQVSSPYSQNRDLREAEAEDFIIRQKTIFRTSTGFFIAFSIFMIIGGLAVSGYYLKIAIESNEEFNPFMIGNKWIPFIAFFVVAPPAFDILKVSLQTRKQVKLYLTGGSGSMV